MSQTTNAYNSLGTRAYTNRPASSSIYTYDAVARLSQLGQHFASSASNLEQGFGYNNASQITTATRDNDALAGKLAKDRGFIPSFAILQTIAFGRRIPDPQGVAGQFMYRIGADHLTGPSGRWSHGMLEVLVYEHTGEIRHVMYTSRPWP